MADKLGRAANIAELVSAFAVVAGICVAIYGFTKDRENQRRQFTVEYAQAYFRGDLHEARNTIRNRLVRPSRLGGDVSDKVLADIILRDVIKDSDSSIAAAALRIADYFNGARTCLRAGICDRKLLLALHRSEANTLRCILSPALVRLSIGGRTTDLQAGLVYFASKKACDP